MTVPGRIPVDDRSRCGQCGRIIPSLEEYGGQGHCRECYREPAAAPDVDREQRIRVEAAAVTAPDVVECATCGGVARAAAWGRSRGVTYRCTECHAGGERVVDGGDVHTEGGVFERLENHATRRLETGHTA